MTFSGSVRDSVARWRRGEVAAIIAILLGAAVPTRAQVTTPLPDDRGDQPTVTGSLYLQLEADKIVRAPSGTPPNLNVYFSDSYLTSGVYLNRALSFQSTIWFTQVQTPTSSAFLNGQGAYVQQAFLNYETPGYALFAGKFNPSFSMFWYQAPGIYGNLFSENNYWLTEADGLGGALKYDAGNWGKHRLSLSSWFNDTTFLSGTVGAQPVFNAPTTVRPARLTLADGGSGNTQSLSSFTASWRTTGIGGLDTFATNVDFSSLAAGVNGTARQNEIAVGASYQWPLGGDWALTPIGEFVQAWNWEGNIGGVPQNRTYLNLGANLTWGGWTLSGVAGARDITGPAGTASHDRLYTASLGYNFQSGFGIQAGWMTQTIAGTPTTTLGGILTYQTSF